MQIYILTVLSSAAFSAALTGLLIWITKTWISERIKNSIEHEYNLKFQEYKSKLDLESEKQIIEFRNNIEKNVIIQSVANRSLEELNKLSVSKRMESIEAVWAAILALRTIFPPIAIMIDALPADRVDLYQALKASSDFDAIKGRANSDQFKKAMAEKVSKVEAYRIYLGDYVWSLYYALMSIMMRFYMTIYFEQNDAKVISWYEDEVVKGFAKTVLSPEELATYEAKKFGRFSAIRDLIETKIMMNLRNAISPDRISEESLEQAKKIEESIKRLGQKYGQQG